MSSDEHTQAREAQFSQNFRSAEVRSGDGAAGGRGGDIGSYNNVNSNNTVNNRVTVHIHSDEKLVGTCLLYDPQSVKLKQVRQLSISRLPSQLSASTSMSSRGSGSHLDLDGRSPSLSLDSLYAAHPYFIFNDEGQALGLSDSDQKTVLSRPFRGGQNQKWLLSEDAQGRMAFRCILNRKYLALRRLEENAALFLSTTPCYWEVSAYGDSYRVGIPMLAEGLPQSNLALSIAFSVASLRPDFETHNTHLHIMADTPENRTIIEAREVASRAEQCITALPNTVYQEDDEPINLYGCSQYIFNRQGKILNLSGEDKETVTISPDFHGNLTHQWAFEYHSGLVAVKSIFAPVYIAFRSLTEGAEIYCKPGVVYWELSRDKDGFNLTVPDSHLGIGLIDGEKPKLRPVYEDPYTRIHLLETSEAHVAEIRRGDFLRTLAVCRGIPRPVMDAPRPSQLEPFLSIIDEQGPCFIVGYTGNVIDHSIYDRRVIAFPYYGTENQQLTIRTDGRGGATIQTFGVPLYIKHQELQLDARLILGPSPFTWEIFKDGDGYRFAVPGTNYALSLGACARIRYLHEPGTCVYLADDSPPSKAALLCKLVTSSTLLPKPQSVPTIEDSKTHTHPIHSGKIDVQRTASEADKPLQPRHSNPPNFRKKSRKTAGKSSSSSRDCTVQ